MDPLNQNSVPTFPTPPVGAPVANQSPELSQDQMKANLQDMMGKIDGKYQDFNSQKFASDNKLKEQKSESLRQIFDFFQSMGIDPSDVEEVRVFLDKIRKTNPELSQQIEQALASLLDEEEMEPITEEFPSDNMIQDSEVLTPDNMTQNPGMSTPDNLNI